MQQHDIKTTSEQDFGDWLDVQGIKYDFESELLGGRVALGFIPVSFFIENIAIRFREHEEEIIEKHQLEVMGYKVIDIPSSDFNEEHFAEVLKEVRLE